MPSPSSVRVWRDRVTFPTYEPAAPDRNPMFLEKRVYQGSSGRVYPLPFTDRVAETATPRAWDAVHLENEFLYMMVLPELGGRIHVGRDKTNDYDFFYRQDVIKPALVGLAGPWISGGVEFNWPQHHRPSTFLPADVEIENHSDGSVTVWLSEHDPMARMKGMHGVCLRPGSSAIELKARAYNRTPFPQTFLWWANVATRVHEHYQSFFPPDVTFVADHAKRATSAYPLCHDRYYGVNYGERGRRGVPAAETPRQFVPPGGNAEAKSQTPNAKSQTTDSPTESPVATSLDAKLKTQNAALPAASTPPANRKPETVNEKPTDRSPYPANDLSWYANIPVPTSYMAMGSQEDFFGGYDHAAQAGVVHIANHHISPGKKQWTWGNHEFGYAWDRNLTDPDAAGVCHPYIEIMAGVYTDNQPDFSFLQPGETKSWSQFWYPIQQIGPAQHASADLALSLDLLRAAPLAETRSLRIGVCPSRVIAGANIEVFARGNPLAAFTRDLAPGRPFLETVALPTSITHPTPTDFRVTVCDAGGHELLSYQPRVVAPLSAEKLESLAATEPPPPAEVASADELFLTGVHLAQYRHATRCPTTYWREALRRDPGDSRCHTALGKWHLNRGELSAAGHHFRQALARLTHRNPNPADGEPLYHLGLTLRLTSFATSLSSPPSALRSLSDAYAAFYKATWNHAWAGAAYHALAEIDCTRHEWSLALEHLDRTLRLNTDNLRARNLRVLVLGRLGRIDDAATTLRETLALDPLDWWARDLTGKPLACDNHVRLDLAHDYVRGGFYAEAMHVLASVDRTNTNPTNLGTIPLVAYTAAWIAELAGDATDARRLRRAAQNESPDYCFPARLEEIRVLESAIAADKNDARAPFLLGHLFYDRRRHDEAIALWQQAVKLDPKNAIAWRCLGIGYFNIQHDPKRARLAYDKAFRANPTDARLLFERDQLAKRLGERPEKRLRELLRHRTLVAQRDDLSVELCALFNQTGQPARALEILTARKFQPWEGGEGQALGQYTRARTTLGHAALAAPDHAEALGQFFAAFEIPPNLGEARHLLANQSDLHLHLGDALAAAGRDDVARTEWRIAAEFSGDFQAMSVKPFSEMTYFSARALERLGRKPAATKLLRALLAYAKKLKHTPATIDYFATSLPTMLLFDDDLTQRQQTTALFLEAQARLGLGETSFARRALRTVLQRDPNHALAADLLAASPGRR